MRVRDDVVAKRHHFKRHFFAKNLSLRILLQVSWLLLAACWLLLQPCGILYISFLYYTIPHYQLTLTL
jgi:hypothetical protein